MLLPVDNFLIPAHNSRVYCHSQYNLFLRLFSTLDLLILRKQLKLLPVDSSLVPEHNGRVYCHSPLRMKSILLQLVSQLFLDTWSIDSKDVLSPSLSKNSIKSNPFIL